MTTLVVNEKKFVSNLLILSFVIVVSILFSTVPDSAAEFEVGTQFGFITQFGRGSNSSVSILQAPSGEISSVGASPYLTFFPHKQFAISPAFNFGHVTTSWGESSSDSASQLYLGSKFHFFLLDHAVSNPYLFGKASITTQNAEGRDSELLLHVGLGTGYQWYIEPIYFLRLEGQYHRLIEEDESTNVFSVKMGIGVRFGNNQK